MGDRQTDREERQAERERSSSVQEGASMAGV